MLNDASKSFKPLRPQKQVFDRSRKLGTLKKAVPLKGGRELFSRKKVRRGFLTYRTTINLATRGKPLRLQSLIALESTSPLRVGTFLVSYFVDI